MRINHGRVAGEPSDERGPTFTGPACLAAFEVVNALGYEDQISNRVVDGIGDLAGGVRLQDPTTPDQGARK